MTFSLKIEGIEYDLWLGVNAPILLFEALGVSFDSIFPVAESNEESNEVAIAGTLDETTIADILKPQALFKKLKTFGIRNEIFNILLEEGEFTPAMPFDGAKLARRFEIDRLLTLIGNVFTEYNDRSKPAEPEAAIAPSIDPIVETPPVVEATAEG